jgi:hypothetical protein
LRDCLLIKSILLYFYYIYTDNPFETLQFCQQQVGKIAKSR